MFEQEVTTRNGVVKRVVAQTEAELNEAVVAVENELSPVAPDINNPADGNKIVSPENKAMEDVPALVDNSVEAEEEVEEVVTEKPKKKTSKK